MASFIGHVSRETIYRIVMRIPRGRVATYGQVARLAGIPGHARLVGYALSALDPHTRVPWHRVVNARGEVSPRSTGSEAHVLQRLLLRREGIRFDRRDQLALTRLRWRPRTSSLAPR